jgi:hypothetical protein
MCKRVSYAYFEATFTISNTCLTRNQQLAGYVAWFVVNETGVSNITHPVY